jgi:hypothetical protein
VLRSTTWVLGFPLAPFALDFCLPHASIIPVRSIRTPYCSRFLPRISRSICRRLHPFDRGGHPFGPSVWISKVSCQLPRGAVALILRTFLPGMCTNDGAFVPCMMSYHEPLRMYKYVLCLYGFNEWGQKSNTSYLYTICVYDIREKDQGQRTVGGSLSAITSCQILVLGCQVLVRIYLYIDYMFV